MSLEFLTGKNILLISPQPWDHVFISKHHYAQELARNDNQVYFLQPPENHGRPGYTFREVANEPNIYLISWRSFFPRAIRFHGPALYRKLITLQVKALLRKLPGKIDVIWCFDFNLYPDLRVFGPAFRIFHPVDPLTSPAQVAVADSADLVISVSKQILANFDDARYAGRKLLVNHGLSSEFQTLAMAEVLYRKSSKAGLSVGYFGNLDRGIIDLSLWKSLVAAHPEVVFHFWGPYTASYPFACAMQQFSNTRLHGSKSKSDLVKEIAGIDLFLLLYGKHAAESDLSNSHKILEYLSTGKVVVSVQIQACENIRDLVRMPVQSDDEIPALLSDTLDNIEQYNSPELCAARKRHAEQFTYLNNLKKIDHWIGQPESRFVGNGSAWQQ